LAVDKLAGMGKELIAAGNICTVMANRAGEELRFFLGAVHIGGSGRARLQPCRPTPIKKRVQPLRSPPITLAALSEVPCLSLEFGSGITRRTMFAAGIKCW
jgi:hypothetical protein